MENWTCVVGLSKTGTTGVFSAIATATHAAGVEPYLLHEKYRRQQYQSLKWYSPDHPVVAKLLLTIGRGLSHHLVEQFGHRLLIVRDPRDRLVSLALDFPRLRVAQLSPAQVERYVEHTRAKERQPASHEFLELYSAGCRLATGGLRSERRAHAVPTHPPAVCRLCGEHLVRHEDMTSGDLSVVSSELALPVEARAAIESQRIVLRSGSSGAWRSCFTPRDVELLRPRLDSLLDRLGYPSDDWQLVESALDPSIGSDHVLRAYLQRRAELRVRRGAVGPAVPRRRGSSDGSGIKLATCLTQPCG